MVTECGTVDLEEPGCSFIHLLASFRVLFGMGGRGESSRWVWLVS